ncbi:MAG: Gfo/Idh/MocA family oxidoreductase [Candidatus Kapabacteria bacterium]|nr:Gfo/Idh/MocA family oxidoreductase [Candidatus Kapabacteria bacterium]MDW8224404.1 Gfo/Idh/MocA family oxidoreductase [Bacteroidota bacterium]
MVVAVLGCGYWGPNLIRNFLQSPEVETVIACDIDERRLEAVRQRFRWIRTTSSPKTALTDPAVHAVAIATPVASHFELARTALQHGKHVLIEKPLTRRTCEATELIALAETKGRILMVDHTFLFTDAVQKLKELLLCGELGEPLYFDSIRANLGLFQPDVNVIWDLASHDASILLYLIEEPPITVSAVGIRHYYELENLAYVTIHYDSPFLAHFHVNWLSPVKLRTICIGGSRRMAIYDDMETSEKIRIYDRGVEIASKEGEEQLRVQYRAGQMYAPPLPNQEALARVVQHFTACIRTGQRPISDGLLGRAVVALMEAAEESLVYHGKQVRLQPEHVTYSTSLCLSS